MNIKGIKIWSTKKIVITALAMTLVCISTMVIQIPIPLGYMHLGNCCILLISVYLNPIIAAVAGGGGSALADLLTGYPQWILPTLLVKGLMGYAIAYIAKQNGKKANVKTISTLLAVVIGIVIMVGGYTIFGTILYGSLVIGLAQIPGLSTEGVLGIILFYIMAYAFEKGKVFKTQL